MSRFVGDSSFTLTWCLPDQISAFSRRMLLESKSDGLLVPGIWHIEMANILGLRLRDGHISAFIVEQAQLLLRTLDIKTRWQAVDNSIEANLDRIARHRLAAYDAIYVELALQAGLPLLTFDKAMIASARRAGVIVITES